MTITVNFDENCAECGKPGTMNEDFCDALRAVSGGFCLKCVAKILSEKPMKSSEGQAAARRIEMRLGKRQ